MFGRRRYIPELKSNNYMVRKFGERVAMNTPIQGTAADIMKLAMINVYKKLKEENLESKIVLQIHDELLVETLVTEKEKVKEILINEMENVCTLSVPLKVEAGEGKNWLAAK
jgi:DNA polymerase-1